MRNHRFYPGGPSYNTSRGQVEIRMGGKRNTFVLKFAEPVSWLALGLAELRQFHAEIGRELRALESEIVHPFPSKDDPAPADVPATKKVRDD